MRFRRYRDEPTVPLCFSLLGLFGLDHAEDATLDEATGKGRLIRK